MELIKGKQVYSTLEELVQRQHTAVMVIDMQKEGVSEEGYFARRLGADLSLVKDIVEPLADFVEQARAAGVAVVHVFQTCRQDGKSDSPAWLHFKRHTYKLTPPATEPGDDFMVEGTWGYEAVPELAPREGELVIDKTRASAFINTSADALLRANGIETVIMTGESSYGCLLNSVMDASCMDYYVVVASDLVAGPSSKLHEVAMELMSKRFCCHGSSEIVSAWRNLGYLK